MKTIIVYKSDISSYEEIKIIVDDSDSEAYYNDIYRQLNCECSEHLEISKKSNNPFGKKIRSSLLTVKSDKSNKYNIDSIYYGSAIDQNKRNRKHLYSEDFEKYVEQNKFNTNTEIKEFQFGNLKIDKEESEKIFDVLFWKGLEETPINFKMIFYICKQFGIKYFTDYFGTDQKNSAKSFCKYYLAFLSQNEVWENLTDNQKMIIDLIKQDYFNIEQNIVKYKKREMWTLF